MHAVVRRCGFDGEEATDLFQEVWLEAWYGLGTLRDERALPGWLATVAARRAKRALLQRTRRPIYRTDDEAARRPDPGPSPDEVVVGRERSAAVSAAISALSERDRRIVEYLFYDPSGPSYADIAERLGVSPDTVGPMRVRCLRRLRVALEGAAALNDAE